MHLGGPPFSLNMAVTVAVGVVFVMVAADAADSVGIVDTMEPVEPETGTKVSAAVAKLPAILQMHAERKNALRRKETTMSAFDSCVGSQHTSKSICISYKHITEWWNVKKRNATVALEMTGHCDPI